MKITTVIILLFISIVTNAQADLLTIYNEGVEAGNQGDYEKYLRHMQLADSLSPMHPTIMNRLAGALAKNEMNKESVKVLKKLVEINASLMPENDSTFDGIDLSMIVQTREEMQGMIALGELAFRNSEVDLHPESLAYHKESGHFFLNSVRKGKILRYNPKSSLYTVFTQGLWAVMGMRVQDNFLWVCEVATPEHAEFDEANEGKTALSKFDLNSGERLGRWELEGGHWFGDLVFTQSGDVLISDSQQPIVYILKDNDLKVYYDFSDQLFNLQGMAFNRDESVLFIADYKIGIHRLDMRTGDLDPISRDNHLTKGTDGLYFLDQKLIAIQNGVSPFRVSALELDKYGFMKSISYLDKARPELNEPTLGVIVDGYLYYVANSPWGAYEDGVFKPDGLGDNLIMKVKID